MASPGQIQIYSPARQLPPGFIGRQAPAPVRASPQVQAAARKATPALAGKWGALDQYVQSETGKATQARAEEAAKKAQKAAQDAAYEQLPWWKKGVAAVVDNPIFKTAMAPAEVLSVPMKAIALGKEELSSHLPRGVAEMMEDPFNIQDNSNAQPVGRALDFLAKMVPFSPVGVDTDKARAEKRSVLERLAPRSDFGHGQIQTTTGNQWGDRFQGLGADIVNDPLMFLEGGGTVTRPAIAGEDALKAIGRGERLALPEAQRALGTAASNEADLIARLTRGAPTGVRTAEEELARQAAGRGSAEARFADDIARPRAARPEATIPLPKNLQERMNLASEWATENPQLYREHAGEVAKGTKRGFESMSPEARRAFGVDTGGISVKGIDVELPGSEALRQVWKDAGGARRAKTSDLLDKLPKEGTWDKVRNMRVPKGQESAYAAMRKAGTAPEEAELALNNVFMRNQLEIGKNVMKARGATHLSKTLRTLRDKFSDPDIARLVTEAETTPGGNAVNDLFKRIIGEHEKLTGRKLVSSIDADNYLPHVLDSKWRRFMLANPDDPFVKSFMSANNIVKDDLLEASHFVDKARKLRLPEGASEAEFNFAGRKVTLKGDTVAAKNAAMHEAFPEWKGDFYSTDLKTIGESYLDSISNDAGAHYARGQLANTKSPYVRTLDGLLWDEYQSMNDTLAQRPYARRVTDVTEQGYKSGTGVEDIAPSPKEPTSEYFRKERDVKASDKLAEDVQGAGRQWRRDMRSDAVDVYEKAQEDVGILRKGWAKDLREEANAGNKRINALKKQVETYRSWVKGLKLGDITSDNADQVVKVLANIDDHIALLKQALSGTKRTFNGKITRESKKVDNELAAELRKLTQVRADLEEHVSNVGSRLRAEIEERRAWINGDVAEKEAALAAKEATVPKPSPSDPDVIGNALEELERPVPPGLRAHPVYQQMVDDMTEAIKALQASKEDGRLFTKAGTIRKDQQHLIDEVYSARRKLREFETPAAKANDPGLVHVGTDAQGRNRYKTSTGYRIEPAKPTTEQMRIRDTGPKYSRPGRPGRLEKRVRPNWTVYSPEGEAIGTYNTYAAAQSHALTEHYKLVDPPEYMLDILNRPDGPKQRAFEVTPPDDPVYHGTSERVAKFEKGKGSSNMENLYAEGVYTTSELDTARNYKKKGAPIPGTEKSPEVYRISGERGPKLDLDAPMPDNVRLDLWSTLQELRPKIEEAIAQGGASNYGFPYLDEALKKLGGQAGDAGSAILSIKRMMKEMIHDDLLGADEAEQLLSAMTQRFRDSGYVALTHKGGIITGSDPHQVSIWLNPEKVGIQEIVDQSHPIQSAFDDMEKSQARIDAYLDAGKPDAEPPKPAQLPDVATPDDPEYLANIERQHQIGQTYREWAQYDNEKQKLAKLRAKFEPGGEHHEFTQAKNWATKNGRYQADLAEATKEERAAVEAARAARDERAGQRESIVRSGPETGSQAWPADYEGGLVQAKQNLVAKTAAVPREFPVAKTRQARELEAEEKNLLKLRYEGSMTPREYEQRMNRAFDAKEGALDDLKLESGKNQRPGEMNRRRNQIEADYDITVRRIQEQYEARLPEDEFDRRMAALQARKVRLARGPRVVNTEATEAAREAARQRLALQQQAPSRVVDPELFDEAAMVKPSIGETKLIKHGTGNYILPHPDNPESYYTIKVDRRSKQPKWDVTIPGDEDPVRSFSKLKDATDYARDDMARPLATTEAQRAALPPLERADYQAETAALARSEQGRRAATTRKLNETPGVSDIISADEWYKANVRAATGPERDALKAQKAHAEQRKRFAENAPQPDPRWVEPLGGTGPGQERHIERINTPPQPEAFRTSAVSAETGDMVGVPSPRTEGEATSFLESQLQPGTTKITPGSELHNKVVAPLEQAQQVEQQYASEIPFKSEEAKQRINKELGAERDERIGEISVEQGVFDNMKKDLTERESLLRKRKDLTALRDQLMKTPARARNEELLSVIEQLEAIAKANPLLDNAQLNAAESLLHTHKEALERIAKAERLHFQVKNLENKAAKGEIEDVFRAVLNDNWKAMHEGLLAKGDVIVDHRLAAAMQNIYEMNKEPGLFGRAFNAFTNLFKTYATLSPGFQVRNTLSGMFMNTADGVGLRTQMEGVSLWRKWERGGVEWLDKQPQRVQDAFAATFASGSGGRVAEAGVAGKSANRVYDKLSNNWATRKFQRAGEKVEGALRLGMSLHSMDRGEGVASAVRRIGRVHFNYAEVSAFDEQAKRLIPFWTFMSRNLPLQLQEIFSNPAAYAAYGHIKRNFEGAKEENEPEYWKGLGTWRLPFDVAGQPAYFQPDFGFTRMGQDIENVTDTLSMKKPLAFMNSVNPGFSAPLDFMYGKDSFTGREYGPNDYSKMSGPIGGIETALASVFGQTNEAGQVSDNFQNFLRSINPIQDRTTRLAPGAVGGDSDPRRLAESWARFIGVPLRQLSPKQQESEALRKYYAMLDEASRQRAMGRAEAS